MPEFLSAVSPQIVISSAGEENPYGHPSPELLQRLEEGGLRVACPESATQSGRAQAPDNHENE